jgi:hypothetical protein
MPKTRLSFVVHGPFQIPTYDGKAARLIRADEGRTFFERSPALARRAGCYIFGMRASRGITPFYVGKATRTFEQECFAAEKINRYNEALVDYNRGTPVLFLVAVPARRGRRNDKAIGELEDFLIQHAVTANPDLLNVKGTRGPAWGIAGLVRSTGGRPSGEAASFARMMKLHLSR